MHEEFIDELDETSGLLMQSVADLNEAQLTCKINPQVWSIHECMEHIVITEIAVYRILMQHTPPVAPSAATEKIGKKKIEEVMSDRSTRVESPDDVKPIGRFSSMVELRDKFIDNRQRIKEELMSGSIVFDSRLIVHPMLGEMTKKDWLNFLIHHCERHCRQIE